MSSSDSENSQGSCASTSSASSSSGSESSSSSSHTGSSHDGDSKTIRRNLIQQSNDECLMPQGRESFTKHDSNKSSQFPINSSEPNSNMAANSDNQSDVKSSFVESIDDENDDEDEEDDSDGLGVSCDSDSSASSSHSNDNKFRYSHVNFVENSSSKNVPSTPKRSNFVTKPPVVATKSIAMPSKPSSTSASNHQYENNLFTSLSKSPHSIPKISLNLASSKLDGGVGFSATTYQHAFVPAPDVLGQSGFGNSPQPINEKSSAVSSLSKNKRSSNRTSKSDRKQSKDENLSTFSKPLPGAQPLVSTTDEPYKVAVPLDDSKDKTKPKRSRRRKSKYPFFDSKSQNLFLNPNSHSFPWATASSYFFARLSYSHGNGKNQTPKAKTVYRTVLESAPNSESSDA